MGRGGRPPESRRIKLMVETATEARRFKRGGGASVVGARTKGGGDRFPPLSFARVFLIEPPPEVVPTVHGGRHLRI